MIRILGWCALIILVSVGANLGSHFLIDGQLESTIDHNERQQTFLDPPYITVDLISKTDVIHPGQTFYVHYHIVRDRICSFDYTTYLYSPYERGGNGVVAA